MKKSCLLLALTTLTFASFNQAIASSAAPELSTKESALRNAIRAANYTLVVTLVNVCKNVATVDDIMLARELLTLEVRANRAETERQHNLAKILSYLDPKGCCAIM